MSRKPRHKVREPDPPYGVASVLIDANVLIDLLAQRQPHYDDASRIWTLCERGEVLGHVAAISFNNCHDLLRKQIGTAAAGQSLRKLRSICHMVDFSLAILDAALASGFGDFEDAIQYHSALQAGCATIITRNAGHFPQTKLAVLAPGAYLRGL